MKIIFSHPCWLFEQGKRPNNEDFIFPPADGQSNLADAAVFIVCDGVGGSNKGEEASRIVATTVGSFLRVIPDPTPADLRDALQQAEQALTDFSTNFPESVGLATTLVALCKSAKGIFIAHVGDSRAYQVRDGQIIFRTKDHSFIQELISNKIISEAEAREHPGRNIVSKAVTGREAPVHPDISLLTDIKAGDYFLICTDGVLEVFTDPELSELISDKQDSVEDKIKKIKNRCELRSKDNFSCFLLQVEAVEATSLLDKCVEIVKKTTIRFWDS
jgi:serine/threonine protein phosphatase PrpC